MHMAVDAESMNGTNILFFKEASTVVCMQAHCAMPMQSADIHTTENKMRAIMDEGMDGCSQHTQVGQRHPILTIYEASIILEMVMTCRRWMLLQSGQPGDSCGEFSSGGSTKPFRLTGTPTEASTHPVYDNTQPMTTSEQASTTGVGNVVGQRGNDIWSVADRTASSSAGLSNIWMYEGNRWGHTGHCGLFTYCNIDCAQHQTSELGHLVWPNHHHCCECASLLSEPVEPSSCSALKPANTAAAIKRGIGMSAAFDRRQAA